MPHFSNCCQVDTYICQKCHTTFCSKCAPSKWRPDITDNERAGNVCPTCLSKFGLVKLHPVLKFWMNLERKSEQIYPDACDFGYIISEEEKSTFRSKLFTTLKALSYTKREWGDKSKKNYGISYTIENPIYNFQIDYTYATKNGKIIEFFTVHFE